ncbi:hypothetical protein EV210_101188 [Anaerospora hongkongensis]|uniref:Uncharacterized protein n=2 Tax=Anaerospora hongkongensis TaxID=244830 RepID=A0A4R1Q3C2_9FIRM|nr:hypothetical protein EV210_101188 [Anaerospora hongkongensis]
MKGKEELARGLQKLIDEAMYDVLQGKDPLDRRRTTDGMWLCANGHKGYWVDVSWNTDCGLQTSMADWYPACPICKGNIDMKKSAPGG